MVQRGQWIPTLPTLVGTIGIEGSNSVGHVESGIGQYQHDAGPQWHEDLSRTNRDDRAMP